MRSFWSAVLLTLGAFGNLFAESLDLERYDQREDRPYPALKSGRLFDLDQNFSRFSSPDFVASLVPEFTSISGQLQWGSLRREASSGVWRREAKQWVDSRPVFGTYLRLRVNENRKTWWLTSEIVPLEAQTVRPQLVQRPSPKDVLKEAHRHLQKEDFALKAASIRLNSQSKNLEFVFSAYGPWQAESRMSSVYFPLHGELLEAWHLEFEEVRGVVPIFYELVLDASSLELLYLNHSVLESHPGSERKTPLIADLWFFNGEGPTQVTPGPQQPSGYQPNGYLDRALLRINRSSALEGSPLGWFFPGPLQSLGNNIRVFYESFRDGIPAALTLFPVSSSASGSFYFDLDLDQTPWDYKEASVVHSFVIGNQFHDRAVAWGFDEAAGNFQQTNFTGEGIGGDSLIILPYADWYGQANSSFFSGSPRDGDGGAVVMLPWDGPEPDRDSALDNQLLIHELAHGLSLRMLGAWPSGREGRGMLEGWSDFYALAYLATEESQPWLPHPFGSYISYWRYPLHDENYYFGIRRYPYSVDLTISPLTYLDINSQGYAAYNIPRNRVFGVGPANLVHNVGEVWAVFLWELTNLIWQQEGSEAYENVLRLVTQAFYWTPPEPNFVNGRDALLQADAEIFEGRYRCLIWLAAAKRGIGLEAESEFHLTDPQVIESFLAPPECLPS